MYNQPMPKTTTSLHYILLYIAEPLEEVGKKTWFCQAIYDSEELAIAGLLAMDENYYTHARIVAAPLPSLTVPDDLEIIIGEIKHAPTPN